MLPSIYHKLNVAVFRRAETTFHPTPTLCSGRQSWFFWLIVTLTRPHQPQAPNRFWRNCYSGQGLFTTNLSGTLLSGRVHAKHVNIFQSIKSSLNPQMIGRCCPISLDFSWPYSLAPSEGMVCSVISHSHHSSTNKKPHTSNSTSPEPITRCSLNLHCKWNGLTTFILLCTTGRLC